MPKNKKKRGYDSIDDQLPLRPLKQTRRDPSDDSEIIQPSVNSGFSDFSLVVPSKSVDLRDDEQPNKLNQVFLSAIESENWDQVLECIEAGVEPVYQCSEDQNSLLHLAVKAGHERLVDICLERAAHDLFLQNNDSKTPLQIAHDEGRPSIFNFLLRKIENNIIESNDHEEINHNLFQLAAYKDLDLDFNALLHHAAQNGCQSLASFCLKNFSFERNFLKESYQTSLENQFDDVAVLINNSRLVHGHIIRLLMLLGYKEDEKGVCHGFACMAMQAILQDDYNAFERRLLFIADSDGPEELAKEILASQEAVKLKREGNPLYVLSEQEEKFLEVLVFCENVSLYQDPGKYPHIFGGVIPQTRIDQVAPLLMTEKMEEASGLVLNNVHTNICNKEELLSYFEHLEHQLSSIDNTVVHVRSRQHAILLKTVGGGRWMLIDANKLFSIPLSKEELVDKFFEAFSDQLYTLFHARIYTLASNAYCFSDDVFWEDDHFNFSEKLLRTNAIDWSLAFYAMVTDDLPRFKQIFNYYHNGDINTFQQADIFSILHFGAMNVFSFFLEKGANIHLRNCEGKSLLSIALECGYVEMATSLIHYGAKIDIGKEGAKKMFRKSVELENVELLKLLLANDGNDFKEIGKNNPLHWAVIHGCVEAVDLLLKTHSSDELSLNLPDELGITALLLAITRGLEMVQVLVEGGADLHHVDGCGRSTLDIANENGLDDVACFLMEHGVQSNFNQMRFDSVGVSLSDELLEERCLTPCSGILFPKDPVSPFKDQKPPELIEQPSP